MKKTAMAALLFLSACQSPEEKQEPDSTTDSVAVSTPSTTNDTKKEEGAVTATPTKVYSNEAFKDVQVRMENDSFLVSGKARVFEAVFGWVLEGNAGELKKGHEMTDAGAPEFGNFSFQVKVPPDKNNLKITLFESSARDGSPQHQLEIPL